MNGGWLRPPGPVEAGLRIGLLGGSFDPAHAGHLYASLVALRALKLDYVWWLVTPQNPLKPESAPLARRLAGAAHIARHPRLVVSDAERILGTHYSIDTIRALQRRFPGVDFVWLMGSDNLRIFRRWRRWREIGARVPIAVVRRPGTVLAPLQFAAMPFTVLDGARSAQSSTQLRGGARPGAMLDTFQRPEDRT